MEAWSGDHTPAARGPDVACGPVLFGSHSLLEFGTFHVKKQENENGFPASHGRSGAVTTPGPRSEPEITHSLREPRGHLAEEGL